MNKRQVIISLISSLLIIVLASVVYLSFKAQKTSTVSDQAAQEKIIQVYAKSFPIENVNSKIDIDVKLNAYEKIDIASEDSGRILREKFRLGLFYNPYLEESGLSIFENKANREKVRAAQRKSMVLLKNDNNILPLSDEAKAYVEGMESNIGIDFGNLVSSPSEADYFVLKLKTPTSSSSGGGADFMESMFPQGRLDYPKEEKEKLLDQINSKPTITILSIGRTGVIPDINAASNAVIADFENEVDILLEMIYG